MAIRYSHNVRNASPQTFVFWVHASTKARFGDAYRDIADRLELPGRCDPEVDVLKLVRNWLCDEANGKWVMVLGNVDDAETFFPLQKGVQDEPSGSPSAPLAAYLPQSLNGSILITSRNKDAAARLAGGHNRIKEVYPMDESQGLQLLQNKLQDKSAEGSADLLHALDYNPLAISQAATYINRRARMTILGYLIEFHANRKKRENLLNQDNGDLRRELGASNSVITTWQMSFEHIRQQSQSAADLLSLMSFFNPQGIPESILRRYSESVAKTDNEDEADSELCEVFDTLQAFSLITATAENDTWEMHALVRFCTQVWLSSSIKAEWWKQEFVGLMAREFPFANFGNWAKCWQLLPHVDALYDMELSSDNSVKKWAQVLSNAAYYNIAQAKYDDAEKLSRRALGVCEKKLGEQHPSTLDSIFCLASVLWNGGKYSEAEKLNRRVLEGREKGLGVQHPDTLTSVYCLALLLHKQKRYTEASELYQRACDGYKQQLGPQHPDAISCLDNFTAMQREIEQEGLGRSRTWINNLKAASSVTPTCAVTDLSRSEATPEPASRGQSLKSDSFYARLRAKMRRKNL